MKNIIEKNNYCSSNKLKVLANGSTNGIDTSYFSRELFSKESNDKLRESLHISIDDFVFIFVGRLDEEKGIKILLDAAGKTQNHITFVGDGALKQLIETQENCRVTGWVSPEQVRTQLAKARVLVFPSLWYETYGLVVAEAAAIGIPAIVSDISAAAERVQNLVTGWHFISGDASDLARVLKLIKDDDLVEKAGIAAYNDFWGNPPTSAQHIEKLIKIYNSL